MLCTGGFKSRTKVSKKRDLENKENMGALQTTLPYEPSNRAIQRCQEQIGPLRQPLRSRNDYSASPIKGSPMRLHKSDSKTKTTDSKSDSKPLLGCFPKKHRKKVPPTPSGPSVNYSQQSTQGFSAYSPWIREIRQDSTDLHNVSTTSHTYATLRRSVSVSSSLSAVSDASRLSNIGLRGKNPISLTWVLGMHQ